MDQRQNQLKSLWDTTGNSTGTSTIHTLCKWPIQQSYFKYLPFRRWLPIIFNN